MRLLLDEVYEARQHSLLDSDQHRQIRLFVFVKRFCQATVNVLIHMGCCGRGLASCSSLRRTMYCSVLFISNWYDLGV